MQHARHSFNSASINVLAAVIALSLFLFVSLTGSAGAETRKALVIGNANYAVAPLNNTVNDARAMSNVLRELAFDVHHFEDLDQLGMQSLAELVNVEFQSVDLALVYFAGHAIQAGGENHLLPVDVAARDQGLQEGAISLNLVLAALDEAQVKTKLIILDACRDAPEGIGDDVSSSGLADVTASGETLVAFATAAGAVADDGAGLNSPYTAALVSALMIEDQEIHAVLRHVRSSVRKATAGRQLPWVSSSLEREIVLRSGAGNAPESQAATAVSGQLSADRIHWSVISATRDPSDFAYFIASHPDSLLAAEAKVRREQLLQSGYGEIAPVGQTEEQILRPDGKLLTITQCDLAASDPRDAGRIAPATPRGLVNVRLALRVCAAAHEADPRNARLIFLLARSLELADHHEDALAFYHRAADSGYTQALGNLAFLYRNGLGAPANERRATALYFEAALKGDVGSRTKLGLMYLYGWGVTKSPKDAFRWLSMAANDGNANAMDQLGNLYRKGEVFPQDHRRAFQYYAAAAGVGHSNAMANLARMYRKGLGVDVNNPLAIQWYRRSSEAGNAFAPYHLSEMLRLELNGIKQDLQESASLLHLSADRGYEWAFWRLARASESGWYDARDLAEATYYYLVALAIAEELRHPSAEKLVLAASKRLEALRREIPKSAFADATRRAAGWRKANAAFALGVNYDY